MNASLITTIIEDRWAEAVANPTIPRWKTLAMMAAQIADALEFHDPDSISAVAHRAVYRAAYDRMLALEPKEIAA